MSNSDSYSDTEHDYDIDWTGKLFDNRYVMLKKLSNGDYASVWIAYDFIDGTYYAIKVHNREDYKTGKKETKIYDMIKSFKSQHLMSILRSFDQENDDEMHHCCVMELMAYPLIKLMGQKTNAYFNTIIKCAYQITKGLNDLHKHNTIHGDLKPENVLVAGLSQNNIQLFDALNIPNIIKTHINNCGDGKKKKNDNVLQVIGTTMAQKKAISANMPGKDIVKNKTLLKSILNDITKKIKKYYEDDCSNHDSDTESYSTNSDESSCESEFEQMTISSCEFYDDAKSNSSNSGSDTSIQQLNDNIQVKITDMGSSILPKSSHKKEINCTPYYRSPEMLLGIEYNTTSDMWALGCTIYEMLTSKIMFDPFHNDDICNENRHHLYMITEYIGAMPPQHMMDSCIKKDVLFSSDMSRIKGYSEIKMKSLKTKLEEICVEYEVSKEIMEMFVDFMCKIIKFDPAKRLSSRDALKHSLFIGL